MKQYPLIGVPALFDIPPPEMQIDRVLPRQTLTGLSARPGMGKTWLALEMARAIATGTPFLGEFATIPGNVVFVGQDSSIHDYARQIRKLVAEDYAQYEDEVNSELRSINPFDDRLHFCIEPGMLFENPDDVKRLIHTVNNINHSEYNEAVPFFNEETGEVDFRTVEGHISGTSLIVFDTLRSLSHVPENDNTLMDMVYRNIRSIVRATGASALLLHHSAYVSEYRGDMNWRGASAQEGALDNWFHIMRPPRSPANRLLLRIGRFRGLRPDDFHYKMEIDETKARLTYDEPREQAIEERVISPDILRETILEKFKQTPYDFFRRNDIADGLWPDWAMLFSDQEQFTRKVRNVITQLVVDELLEQGPNNTFRVRGVSASGPRDQS